MSTENRLLSMTNNNKQALFALVIGLSSILGIIISATLLGEQLPILHDLLIPFVVSGVTTYVLLKSSRRQILD